MNWAALEIMKTIIKNKWSYRSKIGHPTTHNLPAADESHETHSSGSGSKLAAGGARCISSSGNGASDMEGGFSDSDENGEESSSAEEGDDTSAGSVGTKRKATRSSGGSGRGGKGKQRIV